MPKLNTGAKLLISLVALAGLGTLAAGLLHWECKDLARFLSFLVVTVLASRLKLRLPGINGSMSVNLPFLLIAIVELSLGEAVVIAAVSTLAQCLPSAGRKLNAVQALFNVSTLVVSVGCGALAYLRSVAVPNLGGKILLISAAGAAYLAANTLPVAAIISLTEDKNVVNLWREIFTLTFPYFGFGAAIAMVAATATYYVGWQTPLLVAPLMAATYFSYRRYFATPVTAAHKLGAAAAAD
jgi:hypothetical protein